MFKLSDIQKQTTTTTRDTRPGIYAAEVIAIEDSEKYVDGDAFIVQYRLSGLDGKHVGMFEETFFNNNQNRRTQDLVRLMQQIQIDDANDLVGVTIQVEIKYRITPSGYRLPSIVARTPLPPLTSLPPVPSEEAP